MAEPVRITIVPRLPAIVTLESGNRLYGSSTGQSAEINTVTGRYTIESVSGRDILPGVGISWPTSNPNNYSFSITLPPEGPLYMGYDFGRGLIIGSRFGSGRVGFYADFGISMSVPGQASNTFSFVDSDTYITYSDGTTELSNTLVGLPGGGARATYRGNDGTIRSSYQPYLNPMGVSLGRTWARCFLRGTKILMQGLDETNIENIKEGDLVMSFGNADAPTETLASRMVVRTFRNISTHIINLRGVYCTPGHIFLTTKTRKDEVCDFKSIGSILKSDHVLIDQDGVMLRARTGAVVGSIADILVRVVYRDHTKIGVSGRERSAIVRAGIPLPPTFLNDDVSSKSIDTLEQHLTAHAIRLLPEGSLISSDGTCHDACDWPEGSTPFDEPEMQNWIVEADGQRFTPSWILELTDVDDGEGLQVVEDSRAFASASAQQQVF